MFARPTSLRATDVAIRIGIVGLALATGYIHSTLGGLLFTLNAVGYVVAAIAMVIPLALAVRFRWAIRLGLMGYAATTIIGWAIQGFAEAQRYSVVRDFCGHGIGKVFHDSPSVLHFGTPGTGPIIKQGMFFTVEPMINAGRFEVKVLEDGWTAVTRDRSLSAQFEHTVGVTADGVEIFTLSPAGLDRPPYPA